MVNYSNSSEPDGADGGWEHPPRDEVLEVPPLPAGHPAEPAIFARQAQVPSHEQDQEILGTARVLSIGAGGLGSFVAQALLRSGCRWLTIVDPDLVDRTNLPRQLYFAGDLGQPKAVRLVHNLAADAIAGGHLHGIPLPYEEAAEQYLLPADLMLVSVDNNPCRWLCAREARSRRIPAVFTMLSTDGTRCQSFLQGPNPEDACLWCALPNLDPERARTPCAAAVISGCLLGASLATFFAHRALLGWPAGAEPFNFRDVDLLGVAPDQQGMVPRRPNCPCCGEFARG